LAVVGTSERVLTQRELNRTLLTRQLLLERSRLPLARAIDPFGQLTRQTRRALADEAERLAAFHA
jgi:hypothetical protein